MNTAEFLQISYYAVPDRTAIVSGSNRFTYMELAGRVSRLATALQAQGLKRGDKAAIMAVNCNQYVELYSACAKLGVTFVPLNYRAKQEELTYMVNTAEASVLEVGERYLPLLAEIRPELRSVKTVIAVDTTVEGMADHDQLIESTEPQEIEVQVEDTDPTIIIYTSGTTALPKGVVLSYLDLTAYVMNTMEPANEESMGVTLVSVPIYHVAGATAIMSSIWGGRTLVLLPQFDPKAWLEAVQNEKVTHAFVVPTMLKRIMEYPDFAKYDISSLQLIAYGAAPMPYEVVRRAVEVFDCGLMNAYGQTESTSSITYLGPEDHQIKGLAGGELERKLKRLRSVGRPMDDVAVVIMNDNSEILESGREGEICVAGARVMSGYFKQDEATHEAIHDGWLHTGDVGYLDEENYLFITGRNKDLIIRGGENISPGEIEATLMAHPAVEDAAVIGVPDPDWGEQVKAIIVSQNGLDSLDHYQLYWLGSDAPVALTEQASSTQLRLTPNAPLSVVPTLRKTAYDPIKSFDPVGRVGDVVCGFVIHPSVGVKNFKEMIDYAKKNPGKLAYGSAGLGTSSHLRLETLKIKAGIDILHVPYRGNADALNDILANNVQMMNEINVLPHVKAGKLILLDVNFTQRHPDFPDVPTLTELGYAGADVPIWFFICAPAGTPKPIVDRIGKLIQ